MLQSDAADRAGSFRPQSDPVKPAGIARAPGMSPGDKPESSGACGYITGQHLDPDDFILLRTSMLGRLRQPEPYVLH